MVGCGACFVAHVKEVFISWLVLVSVGGLWCLAKHSCYLVSIRQWLRVSGFLSV